MWLSHTVCVHRSDSRLIELCSTIGHAKNEDGAALPAANSTMHQKRAEYSAHITMPTASLFDLTTSGKRAAWAAHG